MSFTTLRQDNGSNHVHRLGQRVVLRRLPHSPTTRMEQLLLIAAVVLIPLEDHIPALAGYSIMFLMFAILAGYVFLHRLHIAVRTWDHPIFLTGYAFLGLACLIELSHPYARYSEISRIGQMLAGAIFVAVLCRDKKALRASMYGYIIAGLWLSVVLFLTAYGALEGATATDFREADRVRAEVFKEQTVQVNLNRMAFFTAQGAVVALVLALTASSSVRRWLFFGLTSFCIIASFLPLSRGGIAIVIISCMTVTFIYGVTCGSKHFNRVVRTIVLAVSLGSCTLLWVPDAVFSRLTFSAQSPTGQMRDARAKVYTAALEHLPDYVITGVGEGNFWGAWGKSSKFLSHHGISGAHNGFLQVTIYWGSVGLVTFLVLIYQAYRCLPEHCGADPLSLCLLGVGISLLLFVMVSHVLAFKGFSLGIGMLVGARLWVWPHGIVHSTPKLYSVPGYSSHTPLR